MPLEGALPFTLREMDSLSEELSHQNCFYLPSEKRYTLKGKNLLPRGAKSFVLE